MDKIYLSQLRVKPIGEHICVKVLRKWIFDGNKPGGPILHIGLVLADEKGDSIYAQILRRDVEKKGDLVQPDGVYIIDKFNVRVSKPDYAPFPRKCMIEFTSFTTARSVKDPPQTFPTYVYSLTPFSEIDPVTQFKKFTDVLGVLTFIGNPESKTLADGLTVSVMREVMIKNLSDEEMKVTLWGEKAHKFTVDGLSASQPVQSVVVLFVGCLPRSMSTTGTHLSGGSACFWYFNPDINEATPFYDRLQQRPITIRQPPPQLDNVQEIAKPRVIKHKTLKKINDKEPFKFLRQGYKCTITVTVIPEERRWSYIGCRKCKKGAPGASPPFICTRCRYKEAGPLYNLSFMGADDTAEASFIAYNEEARQMIRRNVETLLNQYGNRSGLPREIANVVSKKFTISVGLTQDSYQNMDERTYVVRRIFTDHELQAYREKQLLRSAMPSGYVPVLLTSSSSGPSEHVVQTNLQIQSSVATSSAPNILHTPPTSLQTNLQIPSSVATGSAPDVLQHTPPPSLNTDGTQKHPSPERTTAAGRLIPKELFPDTMLAGKEPMKTGDSSSVPQSASPPSPIHQCQDNLQAQDPILSKPSDALKKPAGTDNDGKKQTESNYDKHDARLQSQQNPKRLKTGSCSDDTGYTVEDLSEKANQK